MTDTVTVRVSKWDVFIVLSKSGIRNASGDYADYERGKRIIQARYQPDANEYPVFISWIAEWVGI